MLTSVVLTRACEGGSGCNLRPPFVAHVPHVTQTPSTTLSWAPWPFLDLFFWITFCLNETQKNAHARFSKSSTCAPIFLGPKLAFWAIPPRVHKIMRCAKMRGSHTPPFFSKGISRRTLLDAQKSGSHSCNRKKNKKKTACVANSPLRYVTQLGLFFDEKCLFFIIHI